MHDSTQSWLRLLTAGLFLLLLTGASGSALTVIHLRQQEGRLANSTAKLRSDLGETGRKVEEMTAAVAAAEQPDALRARVGTRLALMTNKQTIWVQPGEMAHPNSAQPAVEPASTFGVAFNQPAMLPGLPR